MMVRVPRHTRCCVADRPVDAVRQVTPRMPDHTMEKNAGIHDDGCTLQRPYTTTTQRPSADSLLVDCPVGALHAGKWLEVPVKPEAFVVNLVRSSRHFHLKPHTPAPEYTPVPVLPSEARVGVGPRHVQLTGRHKDFTVRSRHQPGDAATCHLHLQPPSIAILHLPGCAG